MCQEWKNLSQYQTNYPYTGYVQYLFTSHTPDWSAWLSRDFKRVCESYTIVVYIVHIHLYIYMYSLKRS